MKRETRLYRGDCQDVLPELRANSADAVITDPPYGLGFMGKQWDHGAVAFNRRVWQQVYRVVKPGGHIAVFGGTRTWHRLACAIEDSGFEIRDNLAWLYGSGFPKSLDVGKATGDPDWNGWGTALKPAFEPIILARKPFKGTVASNVIKHGTGALNIDACRIGSTDSQLAEKYASVQNAGPRNNTVYSTDSRDRGGSAPHDAGRFPPNVLLDNGSAAELDRQTGTTTSGAPREDRGTGGIWADGNGVPCGPQYGDSGGASRFFPVFQYQAKAPSTERPVVDGISHPTVKPVDLMRWLIRLLTPIGATVLDPFAGSGTTAEAAAIEWRTCVLIEQNPDYIPLIKARLERMKRERR